MKKCIYIFILNTLFILFFTQVLYAQTPSILPTSINLELSPEIPGPSQKVEATISSYSTNLDAAKISWVVNGKTIKSSKGLKFFSFNTGPVNTKTTLEIDITTQNGEYVSKIYTFKPSSVDLMWQAYGYVPPFYKGKTLFTHQDKIKFIAIPHIIGSNGVEIPSSSLIYKWTRNGTVLGDFSGYGKNTYTMVSSVISRPLQIDVEVTSPNTDDIANASILASPTEPSIVFYENNPLYGIKYQKALTGSFVINGTKETNILSQPFFFSLNSVLNNLLSYKWSVDGLSVSNDSTKMGRVFRQKDGTSGISNISLSIENSEKILQSGYNNFNLQFNDTTNQNTI